MLLQTWSNLADALVKRAELLAEQAGPEPVPGSAGPGSPGAAAAGPGSVQMAAAAGPGQAGPNCGQAAAAAAAAYREAMAAYRRACSMSSSEEGDDLPGLLYNWGVALHSLGTHTRVRGLNPKTLCCSDLCAPVPRRQTFWCGSHNAQKCVMICKCPARACMHPPRKCA
jgi:hypothetical protein